MAQTLSITNGKTFKSFSDLSEAIKALEQETFIVYTCLSSNYIKISDKVVDAAARAKLETKKNKLVIRSAKYACIHYGDPVDGRSTGQRPNQKSYKLGCGAYFKVGTRNEMLYIYDCHVTTDVHEKVHKPCPADFAQYPKQRRLNNTEKERLQQLDDLGVNPTKIREVIMKETGKAVLPKDLDNEKQRKKREETEKYANFEPHERELMLAAETMRDLFEKDSEGSYTIITGPEGNFSCLFIATSEMKKNYAKFPELLLFDSTYNKNAYRLPITCFMVVDGNRAGRVVGYSVLADERASTVTSALQALQEAHKNYTGELKTVFIDKDMSEFAAIQAVFPHAQVDYCLFHSSKHLRNEARTAAPPEVKEEIQAIVEKLMFEARTEAVYMELYNKLCQLIPDSKQKFRAYYDKNWHSCKEMWTAFGRSMSENFGIRTTNHCESHNKALSMVLKRNGSLVFTIKKLIMLQYDKTVSLEYKKHCYTTKVSTYRPQQGAEVSEARKALKDYTEYCITLLEKQEKYVPLCKREYFTTYKTTELNCQCPFYKGIKLPCYHIMALRKEIGLPMIDAVEIPMRWTIQYQTCEQQLPPSETNDESQLVQIPRRATKAQSREQKYNRALAICKQIADSASHLGTKQFDDSLLNLQQIKQLIDTEGAFFVAGKNSGRNANVLRPVEDVGVFDVEEVCSVSCEDDGNNVEAQANYSVQAEESQGREIGSAEDGLALVEVSEVESAGQEAGKDFEEDKDGSVEIAVAHEEESAIEEFGSRGQDAGKDLENEKDSSGEVEVYEKSDDVKEAKAGPPLISSTPKKVIEIDLTIDESDEMINATTSVTKSEKAEVDAVEQDDALDDEALRQISQIEDIALSQRERQEQSKLSDEISEYGLQQISQAEISALSTGINSGLDSKQSEGENNAGRNEASKSRDIATEPGFDTIRITSASEFLRNITSQQKIGFPLKPKVRGRPKGTSNEHRDKLKKHAQSKNPAGNDDEKLKELLMEKTPFSVKLIEEFFDNNIEVPDDFVAMFIEKLDKEEKYQGLQSPALVQLQVDCYQACLKKEYVQILHTLAHWITVRFDGKEFFYYDSKRNRPIADSTEIQFAHIAKDCDLNELKINKMVCQYQKKDANNCGLFAIANATEIAMYGHVDPNKHFVTNLMKRHLAYLLVTDKLIAFPSKAKPGPKNTTSVREVITVPLYCICKMPQSFDKRTMQCPVCENWLHPRCIGHPRAEIEGDLNLSFKEIANWKCGLCGDKNLSATVTIRQTPIKEFGLNDSDSASSTCEDSQVND